MPRKNAMRDNVNAVRSGLPHLSDLAREKIELALLYYESNVDETIEAFKTNGAIEALSGWTEMNNGRGNTSSTKRTNDKPRTRNNQSWTLSTQSSPQIPSPSSGILRPSQRVSNIFQTFAVGGIPTITSNGSTTMSNTTTTCSPSSILSSSFIEQSDHNLQSCSDSAIGDESSLLNNHDIVIDETNEEEKSLKPRRRRSTKSRIGSTSSVTQNHEQSLTLNNNPQSTNSSTVTKSSSSNPTTFSNNRKILTKSAKDLQRQTSTITNVELLFNNEMKSSIKRIDDIFKQIREIVKEREVELYLEMDKVKEQGLNIIHRRQQRAVELRQRIDRCDRLEPNEIDNLRTDIKQFVTDRRYDLGEELTSSHRFEFDHTLIESLKSFGNVSTVDRKRDRTRSISTSSPLVESNTATTTEQTMVDVTPENVQISMTNDRTPSVSSSSNEIVFTENRHEPLPQRINHKQTVNRPRQSNGEVMNVPTNGHGIGDYYQYYDDPNNYQNVNRRRPKQYSQGNFNQPRPLLNYQNGNNRRSVPKQINGGLNSETANTYRRPPPPPQSIVPVQT